MTQSSFLNMNLYVHRVWIGTKNRSLTQLSLQIVLMLALTLPFFASAALQTKPWGIHGHGVNRVQHVSEISRWIYTNECACANNFYLNLQFKACDLHYQTMRFSVMFEKKTIYMIIFFYLHCQEDFYSLEKDQFKPSNSVYHSYKTQPKTRVVIWPGQPTDRQVNSIFLTKLKSVSVFFFLNESTSLRNETRPKSAGHQVDPLGQVFYSHAFY